MVLCRGHVVSTQGAQSVWLGAMSRSRYQYRRCAISWARCYVEVMLSVLTVHNQSGMVLCRGHVVIADGAQSFWLGVMSRSRCHY
ncbi:unnamed protein product [Toxocara canis]|uniref:Uncharacterized protein n=1 Tax=Toxocara canis TaxID=6265 RepID=A0A3P7FH82_TOXCA|nr:unnamed protein product [Toxocara canis]